MPEQRTPGRVPAPDSVRARRAVERDQRRMDRVLANQERVRLAQEARIARVKQKYIDAEEVEANERGGFVVVK